MSKEKDDKNFHCTDIQALKDNVEQAVGEFALRYLSMPKFSLDCTVMDQRQLRDAMGLRATIEAGDPWPKAEQLLLSANFRWHWLGGTRVMFLKEREDYEPDDGWERAEEV
jgi:hypothetical protein